MTIGIEKMKTKWLIFVKHILCVRYSAEGFTHSPILWKWKLKLREINAPKSKEPVTVDWDLNPVALLSLCS